MFNFFNFWKINKQISQARELNQKASELLEKMREISKDIDRMNNEHKMLNLARLELKQRANNGVLYNYTIDEITIGRYLYVPSDLTYCPTNTRGKIGVVVAIDINNQVVTLEHNIVNKIIAKYDLNIWVKF